LDDQDREVVQHIKEAPGIVGEHIEDFNFREGLKEIIKLAKLGNKYFNDSEPWKTVKSHPERAANCLYLCNQLAKVISVLIKPYLPIKSHEIETILNLDADSGEWNQAADFMEVGSAINKSKPLFKKIDDEIIQEEKDNLYQNIEEAENMENIITIDDFSRLDLRVGRIIGAEKLKGSDKLLKLIVDVKDKKLQVVAGLAERYSPHEILNQKVVILVNLEPAKLFGVKSEGMILATQDQLSLLTAPNADIGERIK
jgi:methionyl-tRNA synthetase